MSQHSQRTQQGPSRTLVAAEGAMVALGSAGTAYVLGGPGITPREVVGVLMGLTLTGVLLMITAASITERAAVKVRVEREHMAHELKVARMEQARREREEREEMIRQMGLVEPDTSGPIPMVAPMYPTSFDTDLTEPMWAVRDDVAPGYLSDPVVRAVAQAVDEAVTRLDPNGYPRAAMGSVRMPLPRRGHLPPSWS